MFDLFDFLSSTASEETARMVNRIYAAVGLLRENPHLGRASESRARRDPISLIQRSSGISKGATSNRPMNEGKAA
jgi:hypothetical protein